MFMGYNIWVNHNHIIIVSMFAPCQRRTMIKWSHKWPLGSQIDPWELIVWNIYLSIISIYVYSMYENMICEKCCPNISQALSLSYTLVFSLFPSLTYYCILSLTHTIVFSHFLFHTHTLLCSLSSFSHMFISFRSRAPL